MNVKLGGPLLEQAAKRAIHGFSVDFTSSNDLLGMPERKQKPGRVRHVSLPGNSRVDTLADAVYWNHSAMSALKGTARISSKHALASSGERVSGCSSSTSSSIPRSRLWKVWTLRSIRMICSMV